MNQDSKEKQSRQVGRQILENPEYGITIGSHVTGNFPEITDNGYSDSGDPPLKAYSNELNLEYVKWTQVDESRESEEKLPYDSPISYGELEKFYIESFTVEEETDSMLNKIPGVSKTEETEEFERGYEPVTVDEVMKNRDLQEIAHCINFNYEMDTHEALKMNKESRRYPEVDIKLISNQANIGHLAEELRQNQDELDFIELFRGLFPSEDVPGANNIIDGIEANLEGS